VSDRIALHLVGGAAMVEVLAQHGEWVAEQVLATSVELLGPADERPARSWTPVELADGTALEVAIERPES
jgi:hypothetical protein